MRGGHIVKVDCLVGTDVLVERWIGGPDSSAAQWLMGNADRQIGICWIVKARLLAGAQIAGVDVHPVRGVLERYPTHWPDDGVLEIFARASGDLRSAGASMVEDDLWTACSALRLNVPLITRKGGAFAMLPGLRVETF